MASSKADKDDRVFDVAKPGKTAASASSRPLIIGHKNILKDPMVKESAITEISGDSKPTKEDVPSGNPSIDGEGISKEAVEELTKSPSTPKVSIKRPSKQKKDSKEETKAAAVSDKATKASKVKIITDDDDEKVGDEEKPDEPETVEDDQIKAEEPETEETEDEEIEEAEEEPSDDQETEEATETDESSEEKPTKDNSTGKSKDKSDSSSDKSDSKDDSTPVEEQKKPSKEDQAAAARKEVLEKEISEGQYFVPIGEKTRKKRSLRHILIGIILILLLGVALADLMIDVGIIKTDIKPPVSVFNGE